MIAKQIIDLTKHNSLGYYNVQGVFFTYNLKQDSCRHYHACREYFGDAFTRNTKWVGYTTCVSTIERVSEFFDIIENKLKLKEKSVIYRTTYPSKAKNVILIKISPFWSQYILRRQVFTLLLRCACDYYWDGNLTKAFNRYNYLNRQSVKEALTYFLKGNTFCRIKMNNWDRGFVSTFNNTYLNTPKTTLYSK